LRELLPLVARAFWADNHFLNDLLTVTTWIIFSVKRRKGQMLPAAAHDRYLGPMLFQPLKSRSQHLTVPHLCK
jgi:hypothetical protein